MSRKDTPPPEESVQVDRAALAARVQAMREQMIGEVVNRFVAPKNTKVSETSPVVVTADDPAVQEMTAILSGKTEDRGVDRTNAASSPEPDTSTPTPDLAPTPDTPQDVTAPAVGGKGHRTPRRNSVPNHRGQKSGKKQPKKQGSSPQSSGASVPSQTSHPLASPTPDAAIPDLAAAKAIVAPPTPDTDATEPTSPDLLKGRDPKDYTQIVPGDIWVLRTLKGQELDVLSVNVIMYDRVVNATSRWQNPMKPDLEEDDLHFLTNRESHEWALIDFKAKLSREGYILEKAGTQTSEVAEARPEPDHNKEENPYDKVELDDVWELRDPTDVVRETIHVEDISEKKWNKPSRVTYKIVVADGAEKEESQSVADFQARLRNEGYILMYRGDTISVPMTNTETKRDNVDIIRLPAVGQEMSYIDAEGEEIKVRCSISDAFFSVSRMRRGGEEQFSKENIFRLAILENWRQKDSKLVDAPDSRINDEDAFKAQEEWTEEKLMALVADGQEITLTGPGGEQDRYRRQGNEFVSLQHPDVSTKAGLILHLINGEWSMEISPMVSPEPVPPASSEMVPEQDETWRFRQADSGDVFLVKRDSSAADIFVITAVATGISRSVNKTELLQTIADTHWERIELESADQGQNAPERSLVEARALVAEKREEFIRLERDQKGAWLKLMNFFRTTVGKEHDLSPEVAEAMERYKNSLTELLNLEIENIKQSDLKGEALRQAIAGLVRQFEFAEGETLDEGRRKARLGEGGAEALTDKWKKVWGHTRMAAMTGHEADGLRILGALLEASGATAYRVGVQYNQLTNTTGRKVAAAVLGAGAVGVIVFTGGGAAAATAGLVLGLKKLGAAAGTTVTVKGVTDAVAQRGRERRAEKNTEKMLGSLKLTKKDEVEQSRNSEDTSTTAASEAVLTEEKIFELKNYLQQSAIEKMAKRGAIRRMGRLWRNTVAGVAGGAIALTAPSTFGRALEATQGIFDGGEAATGRIARVIEQGASAPRPAAVASAAEAAASAPSGAASAARAAVQEVGQPAQGGPELPTQGEGDVPTELPNALNQSSEFYKSGLAPDVVKLEGLMGDKVVARGDTLWKYALDGGKAAGLDETQQSRFAALLRDKLTEKLSMVDPDAAKAAGFAPNKAGIFTPNFIRTGDTLHLDRLLTTSDLQQLLEEAKQPSAAGGAADAVSSGKPDIFNTNYTSLKEATQDAFKVYGEVPDLENKQYTQLTDAAKDYVRVYGTVPSTDATIPGAPIVDHVSPVAGKEMVTPSQDVLTKLIELKEWGNGEKFNIALSDYLSSLPRFDQVSLFREIRGTVRDLFDTPEISLYNNYDANYDFSLHPELAKASVARVLADHAALADKFYITYDRAANPLHWTQMQQVAQFAEGAAKTLGEDLAKPLTGEGIDEYTRRIAILAHAKGVTFPGLRMIQ